MPISMTQDNQTYYLHYNQVGTLRAVTDKNQNIIKEITYDTFGNILEDSNPNFKIPFGFSGGLHDTDTNLVHFGYREYDPYTGKWTAKDPIDFSGGDSNLYGYVLGDPVNFVDPWGLLILPDSPAGLPNDWTQDTSHRNPNGSMWRHPSGDQLEWHPGQIDMPGWRGKDHWHHNGEKKHLPPGTEVPDPAEPIDCDVGLPEDSPEFEKPPWWAYAPFFIPFLNPLFAP